MDRWVEIATKIVVYGATLIAVGAAGVRLLLLPRIHSADVDDVPAMADRLDAMLLSAAVSLLAGVLARAWAHTVAAFGLADALTIQGLRTIAIESRWGAGWRLQALAALALVAAATWARFSASRTARGVAAGAAGAVCFALSRTGHAAAQTFGGLFDGAHVLAAGLWAGTLACVLLLRDPGSRLQPALLRAFAPFAATSVVVLGATGGWAIWIYLGPLANLWSTPYGRTLLVKLLAVAGMLLLGGINSRTLHRYRGTFVSRGAMLEVGLAVVAVLVTGWLTETAHP